uniref:Uncharacterized protein n=1 Tax=Anguilla anguilla TaxID=7936 RepID=A0A0E9TJA5_ANGAN
MALCRLNRLLLGLLINTAELFTSKSTIQRRY